MANLKTREFWSATADRAIKTFAQTAAALLVTGGAADASGLVDVTAIAWAGILSTSLVATLLSVLTSISGDAAGKNGPSFVRAEGIGIANAEAEEVLRQLNAGEIAPAAVADEADDDNTEASDYDAFEVVDEAEDALPEHDVVDGDADEETVIDMTPEARNYEPRH